MSLALVPEVYLLSQLLDGRLNPFVRNTVHEPHVPQQSFHRYVKLPGHLEQIVEGQLFSVPACVATAHLSAS